jgi:cytochrome b subunit of formate dehydrogenase
VEKTKTGLYILLSAQERIMHIVLFIAAFIALLTGLPLKFYEYSFAVSIFNLFGSYTVLKVIHGACGITIVAIVIIHIASIAYVWLRSEHFISLITMVFSKDDLTAIKKLFLHLFLFKKEKPEYGRYSLFEKIDYFVSIICLLLLSISGLILMFPVAATSFVSISWIPISLSLHSSLAMLFMVFILISHIFNTHLHPEKLYFNTVWITGTLTEEEMKSMHPLEYKKQKKLTEEIQEGYKRRAEEQSKEKAVKQEKMRLEDYLKEGNTLAQSGKYEKAIEKYKEAIQIYPNYSQARFNLGVVFKKDKRYEEALTVFTEFVDMDPFNTMAGPAKKSIKELKHLLSEPKPEEKEEPKTEKETDLKKEENSNKDVDG